MLFESPEALSSSEDEDASLRATIDDLRKENRRLTEQNYQLQRDWKHTNDELKRKFRVAKVQFLMLAGNGEDYGTFSAQLAGKIIYDIYAGLLRSTAH